MIEPLIEQLVTQALAVSLMEEEDVVYARNQVLSLLGLGEYHGCDEGEAQSIPDLLEKIADYACEHGIIEDLFDEREILTSKIMNCFVARPSTVNQLFFKKYQDSPEEATEYFYELSKNSNYIQMNRIRNNIEYKVATPYGELDITINLSKPEKDPRSIEREKSAKKSSYPKCLLCIENEGYAGKVGHPARSNHRMVRLNMAEENWYLQYSPYVYYNEHCIVLSEAHTDMNISPVTFERLLQFVEQFPHYFLGSNADLPIVGGSILSHEHYQGGHYEFAMAKAEDDWTFGLAGFPEVQCSVVKWPMSVIRLRSSKTALLVNAGAHILKAWKNYSDESVGIQAWTGTTPHNTITPIVRKKGELFELDLVIRNNRTSEEHPLGIFHPHADVHHIKKENIGLIEVMGLAVLPARLKAELEEVEQYILGETAAVSSYHQEWAEELKVGYHGPANRQDIKIYVQEAVGRKFLRGLEDAGVYKRNEAGYKGFKRFIATL